MRLSATDIYAFNALSYLGSQDLKKWVSSEEISDFTGIQRPYLVRILAALSTRGIIKSKKGLGGGYALAQEPQLISLRDVMRAIDGPIAPLSCVSLNWHVPCEEEGRCHARASIYTRMRDAMLDVLGEFSVADLVADTEQGVSYRHCLTHLLKPNA